MLSNQLKKSFYGLVEFLKKYEGLYDLNPEILYSYFLENIDYDEILFVVINSAVSSLEIRQYTTIEYEPDSIDNSVFFYKLRENIFKFLVIKVIEISSRKDFPLNRGYKKF